MIQRLKTALHKKLDNKDGDSIAEVLVALLISSLALVMLASMITSSSKMITTSKKKMQDYYLESSNLVSPHSDESMEVYISSAELGISTDKPQEYGIYYYISNQFDKVVSFQKS